MRVPPIGPPPIRGGKGRIMKTPPLPPPKKEGEGHPIHLSGSGILTGTPFGTGEAMVSFCFVAPIFIIPGVISKDGGVGTLFRHPSPKKHPQIPPRKRYTREEASPG